KCIISRHWRNTLIGQAGPDREAKFESLVPTRQRIDIHPSSATIEAHRSLNKRENRVIAAQADIFSGQKFCPALAHNDIAGHDHFAAEFFYTKPLANAVPPILNAALSFFVSHW